ncbi:RNA polymerase sigma-70 factor [Porifericola rhodea]|uniref:RNA polymerase sigma-70 factor n=1 Tax=Porifericola rhodea TaxID=930972 RepID=UPI0026665965|nr:RNA polymerase sigma-70 factor [Porifericola rhodea]WKN30302.1 RNA polymerase sigma-70 factor [Porifericola rhodea]
MRLPENLNQQIKDPKIFSEIYQQYFRKVFGICFYYTQDEECAQELSQEIFHSLWERRNSIDLQKGLEPYLSKAAKYKVIDHMRKKARQNQHAAGIFPEGCTHENCTENQVLYAHLNEKVGQLVDSMPCKCQQVYTLSREKGLSIKEIASSLLISEKTVKNHMNRALSFLRQHLQEYL